MARILRCFAVLLLVLGATTAWAEDSQAGLAADSGLTEPAASPELRCWDDPSYYCFSECDYFWEACVSGHNACVMLWEYEICADSYEASHCCEIAIRAGLF